MNKSDLRKLYLQKRKDLDPEEVQMKTMAVVWNFTELDFSTVKHLHIFYPIPGKLEFNSLAIVNWLRKIHPEIKLVLSRSNFENQTLSHFVWDPETALVMNSVGITEPVEGTPVDVRSLDMTVVPLLAYDKKGNRVGYGKGFYDRFLSDCRPDAQKVGVSLFPPVEEISDINEFDVALDACISPEGVCQFGAGSGE